MQNPKGSSKKIREYLYKVNPKATDSLLILFERNNIIYYTNSKRNRKAIDSLNLIITKINSNFENHKEKYIALTSEKEFQMARQHVRILTQHSKAMRGNFKNYSDMRDFYMAENVKWILKHEGEDQKIMLWAHNEHIRKTNNTHKRMGYFLSKDFKENYFAIGFEFYSGEFQARVNINRKKPDSLLITKYSSIIKNSLASRLVKSRKINYYLDLTLLNKAQREVKSYFLKKQRHL